MPRNVVPLPKRNGRYPVMLLAGGPADRARELRDRLGSTRGILIRYHLDYDRVFRIDRIPDDVDLILLLKSMCSHSNEAVLRDAIDRSARERKEPIPFIRAVHKFTHIDSAIRGRFSGYGKAELPLEVMSTAYFQKIHEAPEEKEPEPPKYTRTIVPIAKPEVVPAAPSHLASLLADANEAAERTKWLRFDTATMLRELQSRMVALGMHSALITPTSIEFGTSPAAAKVMPEIPAELPPAGNGKTNGVTAPALVAAPETKTEH